MHKDILLIFPPNNMEAVLGKGKTFVTALEPLGILYIAANLEKYGYSVDFLDAFAQGIGIKEIIEHIEKTKPKVIGISCLTSDGTITFKLCQEIKEKFPEIFLVLGNLHASIFADYFIKNAKVDLVVHGEGEYTIVKVMDALKNKGDFSIIKGITYRDGGEIKNTGPAEMIMDLDELPWPARHLIDLNDYGWSFHYFPGRWFKKPKQMRLMMSSRGCPNGCSFCAVHTGRKVRFISAQKVFDELMHLKNKYGADHIFFMDPLFVGHRQRLIDFCELMIKNKVAVTWDCEAHINYINKDILKLMKKAGCVHIYYGIESGVQRLLDLVGKNTKIENIERAMRWTKEVGLETMGLFMLGLPTETREETLQTIKFAKKLPIKHAQFAITTPYPGSAMYNQLMSEGKIKDPYDWDRYSAYASFSDKDIIWATEGRTSDELKKLQRYAIRSFFLRPAPAWHLLKKVRLTHLKNIWETIKSIV
jgi:magnesium-protoporphyrin IX monomethyl ester (oxidative) cyclase